MTTDPFTEAARIIDAHRENERWVGDGVKIECVCGHTSHATFDPTSGPITVDKTNQRDAERMHAAHVAQVLSAQEPTDAEVEAAARSHWAEVWLNPELHPWDTEATESERRSCRREARAALSAARAARRDEETPCPPCTRTRAAYTCPRPGSTSAPSTRTGHGMRWTSPTCTATASTTGSGPVTSTGPSAS